MLAISCSGWHSVARASYHLVLSRSFLLITTTEHRREELRRRFVKAELELFRVRYEDDDEHEGFLDSCDLGSILVRPPLTHVLSLEH